MRQSYNLEIHHFSYLLHPTTQTHELNTYIGSKHQWEDTHEVLSRFNTIWLPNHALDTIHMHMCQNEKYFVLAQTMHPIQELKAYHD